MLAWGHFLLRTISNSPYYQDIFIAFTSFRSMDEESINTSQTPEIIEPEQGNLGRSSVGIPSDPNGGHNKNPDYRRASYGGNLRRNSMGKPTFPNNGQNALPHYIRASTGSFHCVPNSGRDSIGKPSSPNSGTSHYLRASTGSCHDFCKYGRKHAAEVKERRSIPTRVIKPPLDRQNPEESGFPAERKTTKGVKPKPAPFSKTPFPDSHSIFKKEVLSSSQQVGVPSRQDSSNEKKMKFSVKSTPVNPKTMTVKPLSSLETFRGVNGGRNGEIKMGKNTGTSKAAVKKVLTSPAASCSPKPSINRVVSLNLKKSLKLVSPLKDQNTIRKAEPKQPNSKKVPEKTLHVGKVETENEVLESTQNGNNIIDSLPSLVLSSPQFSSLPISLPLSFHEEEAQEEEFECTDSEADESGDDSISDSSETVSFPKVETSNGNRSRALGKSGVDRYEDKYCTPTKLKFRRGRVVDLKSENSGPRRLRFRGGRVSGENQDNKADIQKRRFKKKGVDNDTNGTNSDSEKVILRHQDAMGKKDAQGLFNSVIEETASRLVESRKSKVKALVGAFETVISLQETKPTTQTVT
ncbi:unnamed protein product [Camellia sinensis]